ncbi:MAG TPA: bifunctional riboflavin kinase/FAD synthetase [Patescibacteria group bacterium]|nr:bifunctional riboflavin kinase/FAD synthetase [Patescibacteria group bacterium]
MVLHDFTGWPKGPLHLAVGVFDGVHLGHQALIRGLVGGAQAAGATPVAATFDPLPAQVLAQDPPQSTLADAPERAALLEHAGARAVIVFTFDKAFSQQSAEAFIKRVTTAGDVQRIVVGPDFQFGHGREGAVPALRTLGERHGFAVTVVEPIALGGAVVSSTRIRQALREGDLITAQALLGRPYSVTGTIVRGEQRGRALGFPTINVAPPPDKLLPHDGIYATWVVLGDTRYRAASSLGVRPTFGGGPRKLESYVLDFSDEVYGQQATVTFVERIRDEIRFDSADDLAKQIAKDVQQTRLALR